SSTAVTSGANLLTLINEMQTVDRCPVGDTDFFFIDLVAGPEITLCAANSMENPRPYQLNLALFDPGGAISNINTGTNPCITERLEVSGRYFVRVLTSGSSDRRSVRYNFTLEGLFGVDLVGRDFTVEPAELIPGESVLIYSFDLQNARTERANDIDYGIYYSEDPIIDPAEDLLLATRSLPGLDGFTNQLINGAIQVPDDPAFVSGEGTIGIFIDPDNTIMEVNEGNNRLQSQVTVLVCDEDMFVGNQTRPEAADVSLNTLYTELSICPDTQDWFCLDNLPAAQYRAEAIFATDPTAELDTDLNLEVFQVAGNGTATSMGIDLNIGPDASLEFELDQPSDVCIRVFPLRPSGSNTYDFRVLQLSGAEGRDLRPTGLQAVADTFEPSSSFDYNFDVLNNLSDAATDVTWGLYFSTDADIDPSSDTELATGMVANVEGFGRVPVSGSAAVPETAAEGEAFIGVVLDIADTIDEGNEDNNATSTPITVVFPLGTIPERLTEMGNFTTLLGAVGSAGLTDALSAPGSVTLFAPTDEAFEALPEGLVDGLEMQQLADVLLYHTVAQELTDQDVGTTTSIETQLVGKSISFQSTEGGAFINSIAQLTMTNIEANNGIIHVIDAVLLPPTGSSFGTIPEVLMGDPDARFDTLLAAVTEADLATTLGGPGPYTLFAPTDDAFVALLTMLDID
ncbi:MAG: fasciclin domain-containing protein, partial [Myxococcota bacterium]